MLDLDQDQETPEEIEAAEALLESVNLPQTQYQIVRCDLDSPKGIQSRHVVAVYHDITNARTHIGWARKQRGKGSRYIDSLRVVTNTSSDFAQADGFDGAQIQAETSSKQHDP